MQYVLPPGSVVFTGCVGDDELAEQLKAANKREGLDQVYLVKKGEKTGACAVIITGHDRSLVTNLAAAEKFEKSHLSSPEVAPLVEAAKIYYVEGYFLTHGTESALEIAKKASEAGKVHLAYSDPTSLITELLSYRLSVAFRPQPLRALHSSVLRRPAAADHALLRHYHRQRGRS